MNEMKEIPATLNEMPDYLKRLAMNYAWAENRMRRYIQSGTSNDEKYRLLYEVSNLRLKVWCDNFVFEYAACIPDTIIDQIINISKNK